MGGVEVVVEDFIGFVAAYVGIAGGRPVVATEPDGIDMCVVGTIASGGKKDCIGGFELSPLIWGVVVGKPVFFQMGGMPQTMAKPYLRRASGRSYRM